MGVGQSIAIIEGTQATFKPDEAEEECLITMNFTKGVLELEQKGSCGFGLNVTLAGTYRRVSSQTQVCARLFVRAERQAVVNWRTAKTHHYGNHLIEDRSGARLTVEELLTFSYNGLVGRFSCGIPSPQRAATLACQSILRQ
jgi:hypothetical protein